jgi:hypothetical protein
MVMTCTSGMDVGHNAQAIVTVQNGAEFFWAALFMVFVPIPSAGVLTPTALSTRAILIAVGGHFRDEVDTIACCACGGMRFNYPCIVFSRVR